MGVADLARGLCFLDQDAPAFGSQDVPDEGAEMTARATVREEDGALGFSEWRIGTFE